MGKILGEKLNSDITSLLMNNFFDLLKEGYEWIEEKDALAKASEGSKEHIKENLCLISEEYLGDLDDVTVYNEEELREMFNRYYNELGMNKIEGDIQEELWKRFLLFAPKYLKKYSKSISFGEKRILEKTREIQENLTISTTELKKLAKEQSELQKKLLLHDL